MPIRRGIYVASRASVPERPEMWRNLRDRGYPIASSWIDEAGPNETKDLAELWKRIDLEVRSSVGVVLYAEESDFPLKGAFIEVGIALGCCKPIVVVLPNGLQDQRSCRPVGSWIRHPMVTLIIGGTAEDGLNHIMGAGNR